MMIVVVIIFIVCWLPYHTYFITANIYPDINYSQYIQVTFYVLKCNIKHRRAIVAQSKPAKL